MALQGSYDGQMVIFVNVYAPVAKNDREKFFSELWDISIASSHHVYVGGDFNCTLHAAHDRTYRFLTSNHDSPALRTLLDHWLLTDTTLTAMPPLGGDSK